jgi:hypothetical protein
MQAVWAWLARVLGPDPVELLRYILPTRLPFLQFLLTVHLICTQWQAFLELSSRNESRGLSRIH